MEKVARSGRRPCRSGKRPGEQAFTLVEVMVVVAIIAVISALAVPQLLPEVQKAHLDGASEATASFLARARNEAMLSKRCVRVWVDGGGASKRIVSEKLNTFDCDTTPATFPPGFNGRGLDGSTNVWAPLGDLRLDARGISVTLVTAPSDTAACATTTGSVAGTPAGFTCPQVIFRPNGRTWTTNDDPDDDAVFRVAHSGLPANETKNILVNANGLVCVYARSEALLPGATAGDFRCP